MATPFLALNYRSGTPKVKRYANATAGDPIPGEVTFGAADTAQNHSCVKSRVVQYGSNKQWFACVGSSIYYTTDAGLTWSNAAPFGVPTITGLNAATHLKSGLHVVDIGGTPRIVMFYMTSTGSQWRAYQFNGSAWTNYGPFTVSTNVAAIVDEVVFNNVLYIAGAAVTNAASVNTFYDPGANSAGDFQAHANGNGIATSFAPYRGSLLAITKPNGTADLRLYDYTTGVGTFDVAVLFTLAATTTYGARYCDGFVDPGTGDLICMFWATAALGIQVRRVSPSYVPLDITSAVLPMALTGTTGGGNVPATARLRAHVDQEATPGGTASIFIYYAPDGAPGTTMSLYKWNGVNLPMTLVDAGGNTADALGCNADMDGGQYSWSSGEKHLHYTQWLPTSGGIRVTFKLYSDSGTDQVKIRAFTRRNLAPEDRTKTPAELKLPSVGTLSGTGAGNYMEGAAVVCDNGVTTYQVTVDLAGLGFSLAERGRVILDVVDP